MKNRIPFRAWRNVRRELQAAARRRQQEEVKAANEFARTGKDNPAALDKATADYWRLDHEARRYRNFWKQPTKAKP
jgi:hypothetical protein